MSEENMEVVLRLFKALADESRLRLLGLLAEREHSVDQLAARLGLKAPTVSHHLARLKEAGLVAMRQAGNSHLYRLDAEALRAANRDILSPERIASLADDPAGEEWERKVLRDFFAGEELKEIPASRKKREVVLRWLAQRFEPNVPYSEGRVNEVLKQHHPDFATLRRELVMAGLLERERSVYWRSSASTSAAVRDQTGERQ